MEDDRRRLRRRHHHAPARHLHLHPRRRGPDARAGRGRPDHLRRLPHRPGRQLRADQLRRGQGRHRRHGPHLGDGARPRRDHRQRDRPGRRHRDDRDRALPQALRRRAEGRRAAARRSPASSSASARPQDAAGLVAFLASDAAAGITGQAVGIGGDRLALWSHPSEVVVEFADGTGWSADAIAEVWPEQFAARPADRRASSSRSPRNDAAAGPRQPGRDRRAHPRARRHRTATWRWTTSCRAAAAKYFKGDPYDPTVPDIAADYRAKNMAAVIFTVDTEMATGQPALSNEEIADLAAEHPDVLIPFGSVDPARGVSGIRLARKLVESHGVRGFKFHPSIQAFEPNDRDGLPAVRGAAEPRRPGAVPHRPDRHRRGPARRPRHQAALLRPDAARRRRRRLPRPDDHHGPPVGALAGRRDLGRHAQGQRLHRPVRLVAQVLPAAAGQGRQRAAQAQGAVRLGLPAAPARALDRRLRAARHQARGQAADHEGERDPGRSGLPR